MRGYDVIALDCFADVDTQRLAKKVYKVAAKNGQLAGEANTGTNFKGQ